MKEAGWAITRPAGIRLVSGGVILDGVGGASVIGIYNEILEASSTGRLMVP